jgi:hypothetical protein
VTPDELRAEILRLQRVATAAVRHAQDLHAQLDASALREEEKDAMARTQSTVIDKLTAILILVHHIDAQARRGIA